jgi:hypothetical protein
MTKRHPNYGTSKEIEYIINNRDKESIHLKINL